MKEAGLRGEGAFSGERRGPGRPRKEHTVGEGALTEGGVDKRKQSLYFPAGVVEEAQAEAARLDRSLSWVFQRAWALAKEEIAALPSMSNEG